MGFIKYRICKLKQRNLVAICREHGHMSLKKRSISGLRWNVRAGRFRDSQLDKYMRKLTADTFLMLRYSTEKQRALRVLYSAYALNKAKQSASESLNTWLSRTVNKV